MAKPTTAYTVLGPLTELTLARIRELTRHFRPEPDEFEALVEHDCPIDVRHDQ